MSETRGIVHIVDDDASFRKSLQRLLQVRGFQAECFESADAFLRSGVTGRNGCILLDVHMPGLNGLELQERLSRIRCTMPVVFLTGRGDIPTSVRAMKAGAEDYLTKPVDADTLIRSVENAFAEDHRRRHEQAERDEVRRRLKSLTAREFEVMQCLLTGALNKQVGGALAISEKTVKVHRGRIMSKMGVTSVVELMRLCILAGVGPAQFPDGR